MKIDQYLLGGDIQRRIKRCWSECNHGESVLFECDNVARTVALYYTGQWLADFQFVPMELQPNLMIGGQPNATLWLNYKLQLSNLEAGLLQKLLNEAGFLRVDVVQTDPSVKLRAWK